jgi:hypothetical protein
MEKLSVVEGLLPVLITYTTSNNNDVIEMWASRSASISVGQIQAGSAWIVAVRIY